MESKGYEQYPCKTVFLSNCVSIGICLIGAYIMYQIGTVWLALYVIYVLFLELRLLKKGCTNCYYYGKTCAFGKGRVSALLFKKGNPEEFAKRQITWKDILPDFLVSIIPLLVGIALLVIHFNFLLLFLVILLVVLTSAGNWFVRGSLACKYCKQRELGCPAEKLFNKKDK